MARLFWILYDKSNGSACPRMDGKIDRFQLHAARPASFLFLTMFCRYVLDCTAFAAYKKVF